MNLVKVIKNIQGVLELRKVDPLPVSFGVKAVNDLGNIVYLGPALDKWSMRSDRLRISECIMLAINEVKQDKGIKTDNNNRKTWEKRRGRQKQQFQTV